MTEQNARGLVAVHDFHRAPHRATLEAIMARLTGKLPDLLAYEDVRWKLKAKGKDRTAWELKEIPLDAIVGSVGRYNDFTRSFLPRQESDQERWAGVAHMSAADVDLPVECQYQRCTFHPAPSSRRYKGPGFAKFPTYHGTYSVTVLGARSQVAEGITVDIAEAEACSATGNPAVNSFCYYSYERIFQRTY